MKVVHYRSIPVRASDHCPTCSTTVHWAEGMGGVSCRCGEVRISSEGVATDYGYGTLDVQYRTVPG